MTRYAMILCAAALSLAGAASAQEGPTFDCTAAEAEAEKMVCDDSALAKLDRELGELYDKSVEVLKGIDAGAKEAVDELKAYQRGWIGGRNECWKADDKRECIVQAYQRRKAELVARYDLKEPVNTVTWVCDGNPANELVTTFYDTDLPSVRIERGDTVDVGTLVPAGSGSKYEASSGRWFWEHGGEATYREADPDGTEMTCVPA